MLTPAPHPPAEKQDKPLRLTKRIGATTYKVSVHFSSTSKETMGDKILHLIENDVPQPLPPAGKREQ